MGEDWNERKSGRKDKWARRLAAATKYTSRTLTHTNSSEQARNVPARNLLICRHFWTTANIYENSTLPLHGGGVGGSTPLGSTLKVPSVSVKRES